MRWRRKDLAQWILEEFCISLDETTVGRELRALGFRKMPERPCHRGRKEFAVEDSKKLLRRVGRYPRQAPGQYQLSALVAG